MILHQKQSFLYVFILVYFTNVKSEGKFPEGHLEPLGSHREPDTIEERDDIPSPLEFWNEYVKISKPVVFRGAGKHSNAYKLWSDEYLKKKYGDLEVRLESKGEKTGRVPIGAKGLGRDTIGNFVDHYHEVNSYIVSELPTPMWHDVNVQPCLTCGTFADSIVEIDLWMSGGGSKSLLHKDAFNAINCLYNGTKEWKIIEYKYEKMIYKAWEPEYEIGGYSVIGVDAVDLIKYSKIKDVPWSFVTINAGDCLFVPKSYYHQVNSFGTNNIAVAILFSRLDKLEEYNNTGCENSSYVPLSQLDVDWKYPGYGKMTMGNAHLETAREMLKEALQKGPLTMESISFLLEEVIHWRTNRETASVQLFNILSKDGKRLITGETLDLLSKDELRQILLILERYEPSNTYTYEYSYVREQDIRLLIDTLLKDDDVLILDKFVKAYQEHLGGTEAFAVQLFKGFLAKNENMATRNEVERNLDNVLQPYIQYRKKSGLDDDQEEDNDSRDQYNDNHDQDNDDRDQDNDVDDQDNDDLDQNKDGLDQDEGHDQDNDSHNYDNDDHDNDDHDQTNDNQDASMDKHNEYYDNFNNAQDERDEL